MKKDIGKKLMIAAIALSLLENAGARNEKGRESGSSAANSAAAANGKSVVSDTPDVTKTLRAAADAMGMVRWSDIGAGSVRLPGVDVVTTMEFWGTGIVPGFGGSASKTEYHATLAYNPPAMRVELTRAASGDAAPLHSIQVVREKYAWNESELGAGLVPRKGTATPAMAAAKMRLLQLRILPYGVVKAALAAGDKTKISIENGATVLTFPLMGQLAGITVKATLDAKNFISKVETRTDNSALHDLVTETEYADYADHGEILTDIKSPGHIIEKENGRPVLDIQIKMWDANNPYLVFPLPDVFKKAGSK
jgi:hypothetical protein